MAGEVQDNMSPRVLVLGTTPIARAVADLGEVLGYDVAPFDAATLDSGGLEGVEAVVLASHGGPDEDAALRAALAAGVPYIGLVASRARGEGVVAGLGDQPGVERIHTPAGLDIGPRTPEEIALAILAEFCSTRPRRPGQSRAARGKRGACDHPRSAVSG